MLNILYNLFKLELMQFKCNLIVTFETRPQAENDFNIILAFL